MGGELSGESTLHEDVAAADTKNWEIEKECNYSDLLVCDIMAT